MKLYGLGQAMSGSRIAGSIYGVGFLSDRAIDFSKENLDLLRAAKDNFAKLSLVGIKFNKSNFKSDTDRIWSAIVSSNNGNLLDKISTQDLKINENEEPIALCVDTVYFSEDLPHLKRTQQKWGKSFFTIYKEENGNFVQYQEEVVAPVQPTKPENSENPPISEVRSEESKLQLELDDLKYTNESLEEDLQKIKKNQKRSSYLVYGLSALVFVLLVILFFFDRIFPPEVPPPPKTVAVVNPMDQILVDSTSREEMMNFLQAIQLIYSHDIKSTDLDSTDLIEKYEEVVVFSAKHKLNIDTVKKFLEQKGIIHFENSAKTRNEGN
jgi:hypothetical protein